MLQAVFHGTTVIAYPMPGASYFFGSCLVDAHVLAIPKRIMCSVSTTVTADCLYFTPFSF
jgi:hypothetical protein